MSQKRWIGQLRIINARVFRGKKNKTTHVFFIFKVAETQVFILNGHKCMKKFSQNKTWWFARVCFLPES